ncbi:hypothetical protein, unlikely [Trypanosoma congolense IL3000]|uniref:Uncharacterized protein n=1 Tax=Trypanosoma congolense (strain IL3000) TaxID=1068625 RepID=F9WE96_TRYCI|nr:hypothetical protein, unlikely [Trypanosoma congolense IL3000]
MRHTDHGRWLPLDIHSVEYEKAMGQSLSHPHTQEGTDKCLFTPESRLQHKARKNVVSRKYPIPVCPEQEQCEHMGPLLCQVWRNTIMPEWSTSLAIAQTYRARNTRQKP